jgi:small GTP-binding protein
VILGDSDVGKSSLVRRFLTDEYCPTMDSTFASPSWLRTVDVKGVPVKLRIWDTPSGQRLSKGASHFWRDAVAAIAVCNATDSASIRGLSAWIDQFREYIDGAFVVIAGNKWDLVVDEEARLKELDNAADLHGAQWMATSAIDGGGVRELFQDVAERILKEHDGIIWA